MVRITNVVATAGLGRHLPLPLLEEKLPLALYTPRKFSGLLARVLVPFKGHCQIYANGKITVNGGKSIEENEELCKIFVEQIKACGLDVTCTGYKVVNIIASHDFGRRLNLNEIRSLPNAMYEPELFPGLSLRLSDCTAVIFHTGKANLLGCKTMLELWAAEIELNLFIYSFTFSTHRAMCCTAHQQ